MTNALRLCHRAAQGNRELILIYLIPCHLITTQTLPTKRLLAPFPRLQQLFGPLAACIKRGDLAGFDAALAAGQDEFVKRRIYLTLERTRDIALRNLFRKVFLAAGFEPGQEQLRRTRLHIDEFIAAVSLGMRMASEQIERDEVECLIANMIYKVCASNFLSQDRKRTKEGYEQGHMKGYIAREQQKVVLSKTGAFPGTGV